MNGKLYKLMLFSVVSIIIFSCKKNTTESENISTNTLESTAKEQELTFDSLTFENRSFEFLVPNCEISDNEDCEFYSVDYIFITNDAYDFINDSIQKALVGNEKNLTASAENLWSEYQELAKETPPEYMMKWASETTMKVNYNDHKIFSYEVNDYLYMGGAHGMYGSFVSNIDLENKSTIKLYDIVKESDSTALKELGSKYFQTDLDIEEGLSIQEAGFFWDGDFYLTDNFIIKNDGLEFIYNPYEIAAYAAGMPTFIIPFEALEPFLTENSVLKRMK